MLNHEKLETYINNFYGFGNWNSDFWFIGMEEGGGNKESEVKKRLDSWHSSSTDLIDNKTHHERIGITKFFDRGILQSTWAKLIRLKLSIEGELSGNDNTDRKKIRNVQKHSWGQLKSDNALLDLFPLPSPGIGKWRYKTEQWTDIDYLQNREKYRDTLKEMRTQYIREKINSHQPKVVVFYSATYIPYWNEIIQGDFKNEKQANTFVQNKNIMRWLIKNGTCFVQMPQPSAARANSFWNDAGNEIRKHLRL